jgi:two-component system phosphate regulon sensor histidine kinase PhoR
MPLPFRRQPESAGADPGPPRPALPFDPGELLDRIEAAVIVVDQDRRVLWMNATARRLFEVPSEVGDRFLLEVVRDHRLAGIVRKVAETGEDASVEVTVPISARALRGQAFPVSNSLTALVVTDLTRLRHLETVRQQFVANLSHELRTPVAGLALAAQTLAGQVARDADERIFVDRIEQEADRIASILHNLTQLAALDAEEIPVTHDPFSVTDLLTQTLKRYATRAAASGLTLRTELPVPDLEAIGDRPKTEQALQNLLDNAIKFTKQGEVVLAARDAGSMVELSVRDTGPGIPAQDLARIFERFYKVDRARYSPGSGLGLSIVRHLIELQGGKVSAESRPGEGTTMRILLPLGVAGG